MSSQSYPGWWIHWRSGSGCAERVLGQALQADCVCEAVERRRWRPGNPSCSPDSPASVGHSLPSASQSPADKHKKVLSDFWKSSQAPFLEPFSSKPASSVHENTSRRSKIDGHLQTCMRFMASRSWSSWCAELRASRRMSVSFISFSRSSLRSCITVSASLSKHSERLHRHVSSKTANAHV